jgi:hypothetical protein
MHHVLTSFANTIIHFETYHDDESMECGNVGKQEQDENGMRWGHSLPLNDSVWLTDWLCRLFPPIGRGEASRM